MCAVTLVNSVDALNDLCTVIYILEAFLKLLFYGKGYFSDGWNIYDFICLGGILIFRIIFQFIAVEYNSFSIMLTLFRVAKLMSLFRLLKVLRRMFQTIVLALPSAINLAILMLLVNYFFAVVGVILFSTIKLQSDLNAQANFKNVITAFLTAFRIASGDNWCPVMHDLMRGKSQYFSCINSPKYEDIEANGETNGCGNVVGVIYCFLLIFVVNFIFLNLFVALVVASILEINDLSESVLSDDILDRYQKTWSNYDPNASGLLEYTKLWSFLCALREPLGVCEEKMRNSYYCAITLWMLDLKIYYYKSDPRHYVEFYDVLEALVKKTIYRPQTLDKIFHNESHDDLIDGLQNLWAEKSSLIIEEQENLGKIEALSYYYDAKLESAKKGICQLKKAQLPSIVWHTLKISRTLKLMVRKRKGLISESDSEKSLDKIKSKERTVDEMTDAILTPSKQAKLEMKPPTTTFLEDFKASRTNSRVVYKNNSIYSPSKKSSTEVDVEGINDSLQFGDKGDKPFITQPHYDCIAPNRKESKNTNRVVKQKLPRRISKVNIMPFITQLNLQNFFQSFRHSTFLNGQLESSFDDTSKEDTNREAVLMKRTGTIGRIDSDIKDMEDKDDRQDEKSETSREMTYKSKDYKSELDSKINEEETERDLSNS